MKFQTDDVRIRETKELVSPAQIHEQYPISEPASELVYTTRRAIQNFEQEQKMPAKGRISGRLLKALVRGTGSKLPIIQNS